MRVCAALCLGAAALSPAYSLKLTETVGWVDPGVAGSAADDASIQRHAKETKDRDNDADNKLWDAATEAQVYAEAAAAAAAAAEPEVAKRFASAAAAAAGKAAALVAGGGETQQQKAAEDPEGQNPVVFAPRNFRFIDAANGRVLNVYFHNVFGNS